jgi:hypothetical protein
MLRKVVTLGLVMLMTATGVATTVLRAAQEAAATASLTGNVRWTDSRPLAQADVRVRRFDTGQQIGSTKSGPAGEFEFAGLQPGTYFVDVVDAGGKVVAMSAPIAAAAGATQSVSIVAVAGGVLTGSSGGFSLFGMGPVTSMAVLGAAGAAAVTAVVATSPEASPSQ